MGRSRRAFTLTELMISIGVLGMGLGMAAALFPAGMREANRSNNSLLGSIICQNGLAILKTKLRHGSNVAGTRAGAPLQVIEEPLRDADRRYPWNDPTSSYGFTAFGKRLTEHGNDYEFLVLAYGMSAPENIVKTNRIMGLFMPPGRNDPDVTRVMIFGALPAAGSNLIIPTDQSFESAVIDSVSGIMAILDRRIVPLEGPTRSITVLVEQTPGGEVVARNPIMYKMLARTALKP